MNKKDTFASMRVTDDRRIRHELLPNGRYVEARSDRERAYEATIGSPETTLTIASTRVSRRTENSSMAYSITRRMVLRRR